MSGKRPSIPMPSTDTTSLRNTALALKENVEILTQQRGDRAMSAVTWDDLVALGLISQVQVPRTPSAK